MDGGIDEEVVLPKSRTQFLLTPHRQVLGPLVSITEQYTRSKLGISVDLTLDVRTLLYIHPPVKAER